MRVLLVGATGFVGRHIGKALVRAGHEVIGCARNRHGAFRRYPDLGWMRADLATDVYRETWIPRLMGFDAVINAAGILRERAHDNFAAVHFAGPRALYEACAQAGVRRVIHVSALGCDRNPRPYAETKLRLDRHLATLDLDWVVLRPSLVYGEDSPSSRMFRALAALPAIPVVADGSQWLQPVHVDDLACIVARLLENDAIRRQVLDIGGPTPITYRDFLAGLRRSLYGRSSRFVGIPVAIARLGARLSDAVRAGPVGTDTLGMLLDGNVTAQNAAGTRHEAVPGPATGARAAPGGARCSATRLAACPTSDPTRSFSCTTVPAASAAPNPGGCNAGAGAATHFALSTYRREALTRRPTAGLSKTSWAGSMPFGLTTASWSAWTRSVPPMGRLAWAGCSLRPPGPGCARCLTLPTCGSRATATASAE